MFGSAWNWFKIRIFSIQHDFICRLSTPTDSDWNKLGPISHHTKIINITVVVGVPVFWSKDVKTSICATDYFSCEHSTELHKNKMLKLEWDLLLTCGSCWPGPVAPHQREAPQEAPLPRIHSPRLRPHRRCPSHSLTAQPPSPRSQSNACEHDERDS